MVMSNGKFEYRDNEKAIVSINLELVPSLTEPNSVDLWASVGTTRTRLGVFEDGALTLLKIHNDNAESLGIRRTTKDTLLVFHK